VHFMTSGRAGRRGTSIGRGRNFERASETVPSLTSATRRHAPYSVSLIIPALNEAANIAWVLRRIPPGVADEVILVDGLSLDDTVAIAKATMAEIVMVDERKPGKGVALRAGFAAATCDIIVMLDADGSMDPAELSLFIAAVRSGYDFVKGSRHLPDAGSEDLTWLRGFGNRMLGVAVNVLYGTQFTDLCYGFMAFRRDCLSDLNLTADGFEIETQMVVNAVKAGLRIAEVPSYELERRSGQSNLRTFRDGRRVLGTLLRERFAPASRPVADVVDLTDPTVIDLTALEDATLRPAPQLSTGA
jgi:glycosyltransferase involved in cell wall biosynthesis